MIQKNTTFKMNTLIEFDNNKKINDSELINIIRSANLIKLIAREKILNDLVREIKINQDQYNRAISVYKINNGIDSDIGYTKHAEDMGLSKELIEERILRKVKIDIFKEEKWGARVNSMYLQKKDEYDLITYKCLVSDDGNVMKEVYFRIKDGEETWENMIKQFKGGRKDSRSGVIGPIEAGKMEKGLMDALKKAGKGNIIGPIQMKSGIAVVELVEIKPKTIDKKLIVDIINREYESWLEQETEQIIKNVNYKS